MHYEYLELSALFGMVTYSVILYLCPESLTLACSRDGDMWSVLKSLVLAVSGLEASSRNIVKRGGKLTVQS